MTHDPYDDRSVSAPTSGLDHSTATTAATEATWPPQRTDYPTTDPTFDDVATAPTSAHDSTDTAQVAKEEAAQVKDTAVDAGHQVAGTAKAEAQNVVGEAKDQALGLLDQAKSEAGSQASGQQQRLAGLLDGYTHELQAMTSGRESSGPLTDLARQGADKAGELTTWLQDHEPAELLDEVRAFARRRPVAFLVGAALAGVVVGRATRGFAANAKAEKGPSAPVTPQRAELPTVSRSLVEEVPTQADAYGTTRPADDTTTAAPAYDAPPGYGVPPTYGSVAAVSPAFADDRPTDQGRDDVIR